MGGMNPSARLARYAWPSAIVQEGKFDGAVLVVHQEDRPGGRLAAFDVRVERFVREAEEAVAAREASAYGDALLRALGLASTFVLNDGKHITRIALAPREARVEALLSLCPPEREAKAA